MNIKMRLGVGVYNQELHVGRRKRARRIQRELVHSERIMMSLRRPCNDTTTSRSIMFLFGKLHML